MRARAGMLIGLGALIAATAIFSKYLPIPVATVSEIGSKALFAAKFPDIVGNVQPISQWRDKVLIVNFWATWCPPCREEMPELDALQQKYAAHGLAVVGIATDDMGKTRGFAAETKIGYPLLVGDMEGASLSASLGDDRGILPYTVIVNRQGKIVSRIFGRIDKDALEQVLQPLL